MLHARLIHLFIIPYTRVPSLVFFLLFFLFWLNKINISAISKNARSESYRLRNQGFLIEALSLTASTIRSITSIDGAVLMNLDGYCHGNGVILEGVATEKGDVYMISEFRYN